MFACFDPGTVPGGFFGGDSRKEGVGYKIRQAQLEKIPYFFNVGDKEVEAETLSLRSHKEGDLGVMAMEDVLNKIFEENETKAR